MHLLSSWCLDHRAHQYMHSTLRLAPMIGSWAHQLGRMRLLQLTLRRPHQQLQTGRRRPQASGIATCRCRWPARSPYRVTAAPSTWARCPGVAVAKAAVTSNRFLKPAAHGRGLSNTNTVTGHSRRCTTHSGWPAPSRGCAPLP